MLSQRKQLWFAWKFLSLWYQTQLMMIYWWWFQVVICLKISIFVVSNTTFATLLYIDQQLWFAWKFLSLWYQTQLTNILTRNHHVVICLKISIFVVSNTTLLESELVRRLLWFAWKFLSLWYQTQRDFEVH